MPKEIVNFKHYFLQHIQAQIGETDWMCNSSYFHVLHEFHIKISGFNICGYNFDITLTMYIDVKCNYQVLNWQHQFAFEVCEEQMKISIFKDGDK